MSLSSRVFGALRSARRRIGGDADIPAWMQIGGGTSFTASQVIARDPRDVSVRIGAASDVQGRIVLERAGARVRIGHRTHVGGGTLLDSAVEIVIGDDVLVSFDALFMDHDSHSLRFSERRHDVNEWMAGRKDWSNVRVKPIRVGDKAWIGARAILLKGVTVGEGGVVGAGSVVTRDVPPWTVVAGNPARVIRELGEAER